ncbi:biotin--[acetyl-CoA-carboxylase] ligase [Pseudodesulfovibrio sp. zrk46]|uniref:biotin--[acetyl-CoA-carboxylase] ligase n=1 Tax=Pseudodesulfovibrio sp. zrk46 TaxID=2725288 RepID=UPI001448B4E7|nr:biotin--[acetyl-CoA-carboxylase] ligase [Pseudodesulfovibrio sp. zrk46]QJB57759.1 biotin--[acetyl-CoA-carboxylase] ligase [Pseudodesulfovibrio sp. zrk46]
MLPQGIYYWESGAEGVVPATRRSQIVVSKSWSNEFDRLGVWQPYELEGVGSFQRSVVESSCTVVVVNECTSTMEVARYLAEKGALGAWGAVIAVNQTHGRGQLRRHWISPAGNLHVSVVLPNQPEDGPWLELWSHLLPLVCGYVFAEAFAELGTHIELKWPNDFLQQDRKVGGMLLEEKGSLVILGMGVNLEESPPDDKMREDRSVPAAILKTDKASGGPLALWEILVNRGESVYVGLLDELEPEEFLSAMTSRLAWLGHRVRIHERESDVYYADIVGVSPLGGLVIRREGKESVLFSGSIAPL